MQPKQSQQDHHLVAAPADLMCLDPLARRLAAAAPKAGLLDVSRANEADAMAFTAAAATAAGTAGGLGSGTWAGEERREGRRAEGPAAAETPSAAGGKEGIGAGKDGVLAVVAATGWASTSQGHKGSAEGRGWANAWTKGRATISGGHTAAAIELGKGPGAAAGGEGGFAGGSARKEVAKPAMKGCETTAAAGGLLGGVAAGIVAEKTRFAVAKGEQLKKVKVESQAPAVAASPAGTPVAAAAAAAAVAAPKLGELSVTAAAHAGAPSCPGGQAAMQVGHSVEQLGGCPLVGQGEVGALAVTPSKLQGVGDLSTGGGVSGPGDSRGTEVGVCKQEPLPSSTPSAQQQGIAGSRSRKRAAFGAATAAGLMSGAGEQEGQGGGGQGQSSIAAAGREDPEVWETEGASAREEQVQSASPGGNAGSLGYKRQKACFADLGNRDAARPGEQPAAALEAGKGPVAGPEARLQANNVANPAKDEHAETAAAAGVLAGVAAAVVAKKRSRAADMPMQANASGTAEPGDLKRACVDRGAKDEQLLTVKVESEHPVIATLALPSVVAPTAATTTCAKLQKSPVTAAASAGAHHAITEHVARHVGASSEQQGNSPMGGQGYGGATEITSSKLQGVGDLSKDAWISLPAGSRGVEVGVCKREPLATPTPTPFAQQRADGGRRPRKRTASRASAGAGAAPGAKGFLPCGSTECTAAAAGAPAEGRAGSEGETGRAARTQQAAAQAPGAVDATFCSNQDIIVISSDDDDDCQGQRGDRKCELLHPGQPSRSGRSMSLAKRDAVSQQGRVAMPGVKAEQGALVGGRPSSADRVALMGRIGAASGTGDTSNESKGAPASKQGSLGAAGNYATPALLATAGAGVAAKAVEAEAAGGSDGLHQPSAFAAALGDPSNLAGAWGQAAADAAGDSSHLSAGPAALAVISASATRAAKAGLDGNPDTILSAAPAAGGVDHQPAAGADAVPVCSGAAGMAIRGSSGGVVAEGVPTGGNAPIRVVQSGAIEAGVGAGGAGVTCAIEAPHQYVLKDTSDVQEAAEEVLRLCGDLEVKGLEDSCFLASVILLMWVGWPVLSV